MKLGHAPKVKFPNRRAIAACLTSVFLLSSCGGNKQVRFSTLFKEDDELTANMAFKIVERKYRIKPDRRFLLALSDIAQIVTGKSLEKVETVFADGRWTINADGKTITVVNEFATFEEICSSLDKFARTLEGDQGQKRLAASGKTLLNLAKVDGPDEPTAPFSRVEKTKESDTKTVESEKKNVSTGKNVEIGKNVQIGKTVEAGKSETKATQSSEESDNTSYTSDDPIENLLAKFSSRYMFDAIGQINSRWKNSGGTQELCDQAASALSNLSFQVLDDAGTADALFGKALAFSVLSKRFETLNSKRNLVRLAESMGYRAEAYKLARQLDEQDPLRLYILYQAETVGAAIEQGLRSNETKFLYAKKLAQVEKLQFLKKFQAPVSLTLPVSACEQKAFKAEPWTAYVPLNTALFYELDASKPRNISDQNEKFFPRLNRYFKDLKTWPKEYLIPQTLVTTYYEAFAYSWILNQLEPKNGSYTPQEAEKIFDDNFGKPEAAQSGNSICTFAHSILDSRTGNYHVAKLLGDAISPKDLGDYPCFLAFDEASRWFANGDPKLLSAGKTIFESIDSRPENRFRAALIAHNELLHPVLAQNLSKSGFDTDHDGTLTVIAAQQSVNQELLRRIADTKTGIPSVRARAMAALCSFTGSTDSGSKSIYVDRLGELLESSPGNFDVLKDYVQTAILAGKTAIAIETTKKWMESLKNEKALFEDAEQLLATLYYSNGNTNEALKLLDGKTDTQSSAPVAKAYVNALAQDGNNAKAEAFADTYYIGNRTSPAALALKSQIFWRKKQYTEAAAFLKAHPFFIKEEEWRREIYPAFKHSLAGFPKEIEAAARALAKDGFAESTNIGELAQSFSYFGRNDIGFNLLNAVLNVSFSGHELNYLNLATLAYSYLQKSEGDKIALKWTEEKIPPQFFTPLAMFAFQNGAYELLWKLIPRDPQGVGAEYVWLTRAAAMPMQKTLSKEENQSLINHYAKKDDDALFQIGKCLLGVSDSKALREKRINVRELCDLSYFMGWREVYLGDQTAAAEWFHMALETGVNKASESSRNAEAIRCLSSFYPGWTDKY